MLFKEDLPVEVNFQYVKSFLTDRFKIENLRRGMIQMMGGTRATFMNNMFWAYGIEMECIIIVVFQISCSCALFTFSSDSLPCSGFLVCGVATGIAKSLT